MATNECKYTSPSGAEFDLLFEDVDRSAEKKTNTFEFLSSSQVYVQDNGTGAKTYPMIVFFAGSGHEKKANNFFRALSEVGAGTLNHPMYGTLTVNVSGSIEQIDKITNGGNQTKFNITFIETITELYPSAQDNMQSVSELASSAFDSVVAAEFASGLKINGAVEESFFSGTFKDITNRFSSSLSPIANLVGEASRNLNDALNSVSKGIDTFLGEPLLIAHSAVMMVKSVSNMYKLYEGKIQAYSNLFGDITSSFDDRSSGSSGSGSSGSSGSSYSASNLDDVVLYRSKLSTYSGLLDSIIGADETIQSTNSNVITNKTIKPTNGNVGVNNFCSANLFAAVAVSAIAETITGSNFETAEDAYQAIELLNNSFIRYVAWRERNADSVGYVDEGGSYDALLTHLNRTARAVTNNASELKRHRYVILEREMLLVDFCYQYQKTMDPRDLEQTSIRNKLTTSELMLLPKGKMMVYVGV